MPVPPDNPPPPFDPDAVSWPVWCCAILQNAAGEFLLEQRPGDAALAPAMLTCFGGRRGEGESPERCIRRELREELGIEVPGLRPVVRLIGSDELAWFFAGPAAAPPGPFRTEPGRGAVWVDRARLGVVQISAWHREAILAFLEGRPIARVSD